MGFQLIFILISFWVIWNIAISVNAKTMYTDVFEDRQMYDLDFCLGTDDSEYVGLARLESVAVSEDGRYALCFSDAASHHVNLYNQSCVFLKHFAFYDSGAISVSFDKDDGDMVIYPFRKNVLIKIDNDGNYIGSSRCEAELERTASMDAMREFQVSYEGNTYSFSGKNIFSLNNQVFTVMDENENLLFEYAPSTFWRIVRVIFWIAFSFLCIITPIIFLKKLKKL